MAHSGNIAAFAANMTHCLSELAGAALVSSAAAAKA